MGTRLRVIVAPGVRIGPGKAALLEGIKETGSILAAGRRINMSYKRAWYLVEAMNGHFDRPQVSANRGGSRGGGRRVHSPWRGGAGVLPEIESISKGLHGLRSEQPAVQ